MNFTKNPQRKKRAGLCIAFGCTKPMGKKKALCDKHHSQAFREKHPYKALYDTLRSNAKRRRKTFTITLQEFTDFCIESDYMVLKGRRGDSMTIDRNDPNKGYEIGNLVIMPKGDNCRKQWLDKKLYGNKQTWKEPPIIPEDEIEPIRISEEPLF